VITFKVKYQTLGNHVHCDVWSSPGKNLTASRCGSFVIRAEEFIELKKAFRAKYEETEA
jgi:hypothetical protein